MSNIEWTEATWNPIVGCSIVSPGCTNCYAMRMAARLEAVAEAGIARRTDPHHGGKTFDAPTAHYIGTTRRVNGNAVWTGKVALAPEHVLTAPLRRRKPTVYFVNSMGDLFHEDVPDEWIDRVFAVMALSPQHTFQVLTKRSARMREYINEPHRESTADEAADNLIANNFGTAPPSQRPRSPFFGGVNNWPLPNVWLGVSAERQQEADARIPDLLATPAAVRFVSAEPLLGPVDFTRIAYGPGVINALNGYFHGGGGRSEPEQHRLDWIIVGGESGPGARPMHPDWARSIRDQCVTSGVPFFFKQWGEWAPVDCIDGERREWRIELGQRFVRVGKSRAGRLLDGREWNDTPAQRTPEPSEAV